MRPRTDAAYFDRRRVGLDEQRIVERHEAVLHLQGRRVIALEAGILHLRAQARRDIGGDRNAAMAAMRHEAESRRVLAGELDEIRAHGVPLLADAGDVGGRILHADDVLQLVEPRHRIDRHVDHRAAGDVVDDDRDADRVVDRLEMGVHAVLGRLVVIGRDDQDRVGADPLGMLGEPDRLGGAVRAGAGDDRDPALDLVDRDLDDPLMFLMAQGRALARGPDRHDTVAAILDLPVDEFAKARFVDSSVFKWGHERRDGACEWGHRKTS